MIHRTTTQYEVQCGSRFHVIIVNQPKKQKSVSSLSTKSTVDHLDLNCNQPVITPSYLLEPCDLSINQKPELFHVYNLTKQTDLIHQHAACNAACAQSLTQSSPCWTIVDLEENKCAWDMGCLSGPNCAM